VKVFGVSVSYYTGKLEGLLPHDSAAVLWQEEPLARSGYDEAREAPFNQAINIYGDGVPK